MVEVRADDFDIVGDFSAVHNFLVDCEEWNKGRRGARLACGMGTPSSCFFFQPNEEVMDIGSKQILLEDPEDLRAAIIREACEP
jgi:hypothetical protein